MKTTKPRRKRKLLTGEAFDALSAADKERIFNEFDSVPTDVLLAQSKPLTKKERAEWNEWKRRRGGRPRVGKGAKVIALSVERELLKQADVYAKSHGLKRSQVFAEGLRAVIGLAS